MVPYFCYVRHWQYRQSWNMKIITTSGATSDDKAEGLYLCSFGEKWRDVESREM